jgi:hypothetical protein
MDKLSHKLMSLPEKQLIVGLALVLVVMSNVLMFQSAWCSPWQQLSCQQHYLLQLPHAVQITVAWLMAFVIRLMTHGTVIRAHLALAINQDHLSAEPFHVLLCHARQTKLQSRWTTHAVLPVKLFALTIPNFTVMVFATAKTAWMRTKTSVPTHHYHKNKHALILNLSIPEQTVNQQVSAEADYARVFKTIASSQMPAVTVHMERHTTELLVCQLMISAHVWTRVELFAPQDPAGMMHLSQHVFNIRAWTMPLRQ